MMVQRKALYSIITLCILIASFSLHLFLGGGPSVYGEDKAREGLQRYHELQKLHIKWSEGLFGSKKYYRSRLKVYCNTLINKEVETDYSFILLSPEGVVDKKVQCRFRFGSWLKIYGDLDVESVRKVIGKKGDMLKKWWRTNVLVSVSGKVRKYRLHKDRYGDVIELYFYNVKMVYSKNGKIKKD